MRRMRPWMVVLTLVIIGCTASPPPPSPTAGASATPLIPSPSVSPAATVLPTPTVLPSPLDSYLRVLAAAQVDRAPQSIAAADDAIWVGGDLGASRVDLAAGRTTAFAAGSAAVVAAGPAGVWMASYADDIISRLDPQTAAVERTIPVEAPVALAVDDQSVWVLAWRSGLLQRYNAESGVQMASLAVDDRPVPFIEPNLSPTLIVVPEGIWVATAHGVVHVDAQTNQVSSKLDLPRTVRKLAFGGGSLWAAADDKILRIDPSTGEVIIEIPAVGVGDLVVDGSTLWAIAEKVTRVDTQRNVVTDLLQTDFGLSGLAVADGALWSNAFYDVIPEPLTIKQGAQLLRLDTRGSASAVAAPEPVAAAVALPVTVVYDLQYLECPTGDPCDKRLDVHQPAAPPGTPASVIVLYHGACGDCRFALSPLADVLANRGAVVYNVDSDSNSQSACAVLYARATAADYGGDPSRITIVGHSMGASVVRLIGSADLQSDGCASTVSDDVSPVQGVVELDGNSVFAPSLFAANPNAKVRFIFADRLDVTAAMVANSIAALRTAGFDADGVVVDGASHTDPIWDLGTAMPTIEMILDLAGLTR